jgi:hypothetical protein
VWIVPLLTVIVISLDLWLANLNRTSGPAQLSDLTTLGSAVIGALVVSRRPRNAVGWLLCAVGVLASLTSLVWDYGFHAVVAAGAGWPLGSQALWLGNWLWVPAAGIALPALTVRLPNGHAGHAWRAIDGLAIAGTVALVLAMALAPGGLDIRTSARNPFGVEGAAALLSGLRWLGYLFVAAAVIGSVASLVGRLRRAKGDEREQIKWIAGAGVIVALALAYGFVRQVFFGQVLYFALVPFFIATASVPIAIGVAVLKYRLYEVNLIINRALVYGGLTAALAGLYALSIALTQRLLSISGQRSDAAILLTAFVGATAFTPLKGWLQSAVDRRFEIRDPVRDVNSFRDRLDVVVDALDPSRLAPEFVNHLASSFQAEFVSLSLDANGRMTPRYSSGMAHGEPALTIALRSQGEEIGVLALGQRHDGLAYTQHDKQALQRCADSMADAISLWTTKAPRVAPDLTVATTP